MPAVTKIVKDRKVYVGAFDLSADEMELELKLIYDEVECTTFGDGTHFYKPGLPKLELMQKGYVADGADLVDEVLFNRMRAPLNEGIPITIQTNAVTYILSANALSYETNMPVGELPTFEFSVSQGGVALVRATTVQDGEETVSGESAGEELGEVEEGKRLYASLHVLAVEGAGSIAVKIESDNNAPFASPTDQIVFTTRTAPGAEFKSKKGPITDDLFRAVWTITDFDSVTFAVTIGIE